MILPNQRSPNFLQHVTRYDFILNSIPASARRKRYFKSYIIDLIFCSKVEKSLYFEKWQWLPVHAYSSFQHQRLYGSKHHKRIFSHSHKYLYCSIRQANIHQSNSSDKKLYLFFILWRISENIMISIFKYFKYLKWYYDTILRNPD